ncbi:MAG TPA: hypothetical protein VK890_06310 [Bacteroidia bacterium]|jgi:hypothetical protein|nr:hypothetical protein [Bacteroidia bacterium]
MERTEIVTNGCTGNCCAKFHLPYNLEELKRCQTAIRNGESQWYDNRGKVHHVLVPEELDYIIDMLIDLGKDSVCPERNEPIVAVWNRYCEKENKIGELPSDKILERYFNGMEYRDGQIYGNFYTCKHFDAVNKICTAYEQRPEFCRRHGGSKQPCEYDGCQMEGSRCQIKKKDESIHNDISNL